MKKFVFAALVAIAPGLVQAEAVFTDGTTSLTNKRVAQLSISSNETKNVVIRFTMHVDDDDASVTLTNSSLAHVYFPDDYKNDTKGLWFRASADEAMYSTWDTGLHTLTLQRVGEPGGMIKVDCLVMYFMLNGATLVLQIPEDERQYTFDLTSDAVVDARQIFGVKAEHIRRSIEQKVKADEVKKEHEFHVNSVTNAGKRAGVAKAKKSPRKPSESYARRIASIAAKKYGYSGADVGYFVSGFIKGMGY